MNATYFAYVHARPETLDATGIFYIGKGNARRANSIKVRNRYHGFVVKKYGEKNILKGSLECSSEATAFDLERGLIKCLKRMSVQLTNMSDGGEGPSGMKHTAETRKQYSEQRRGNQYAKGMKHSEETKKHLSDKMREVYATTDVKKRIGEKLKGNTHLMGHVHSLETRKKISESLLRAGYKHTEEFKRRMTERLLRDNPRKGRPGTMLGKHLSDETKAKLAAINRGKVHSVESSLKKSLAIKGRVWVTDGKSAKRLHLEEVDSAIAQGWKRGRR